MNIHHKIKTFTSLFASVCCILASAQNPISPMGVYLADPSARVAPDGRLYIYGSRDESPDYYCSDTYDILSTSDLINWKHEKNTFSWKTIIYAPDAVYKDGKTLLYFENPGGDEFVAEGESPIGPFKEAEVIEGPHEIDPAVFIDDDGQAYYFFGQMSSKAYKMNPDLKTLEQGSFTEGFLDEENNGFHEGIFAFKRGRYYYLVYADISRNHRPTCIGYSMATSPLGPYTYKGVIIDNAGCDPEVWNNHGSVVRYKRKWYVLYHRATHGCVAMRKACIERIRFNRDGTIDEVEMTTQGTGKPLDCMGTIDAARACKLSGHVRIEKMTDDPEREILSQIQDSDSAVWKYIRFRRKVRSVSIRVRSDVESSISLSADKIGGKEIARITIPASNDWQLITIPARVPRGSHALWASFAKAGSGNGTFQLDYVRFER